MSKILLLSLTALLLPATVQAQTIVPDASLPQNSVVETVENVHNISGGTTAGNNLFHSFDEFGIDIGNTANFNNATEIQNIFSRVTGDNISNIDGLIRANGEANLYLLNPNGIVFGEDAAIDIGGSFSAIAEEAITFDDGEYNAVAPDSSTLSINLPLGVQLGENPGNIEVRGSGSGLFFNRFGEPDLTTKIDGLISSEINLTAGNITIDGGNVTASELNLNAASGIVEILNRGSLNGAGGKVEVAATDLNIADGSAIIAMNEVEQSSGEIEINASSVNVSGESANFPSFISTDNLFGATQPGGKINLDTNQLLVDAGAVISASSYSEADGGEVSISADEVEIVSGGVFASSIAIESVGGGTGGYLNLNASQLRVIEGGSITATAEGSSTGGTINLNVDELIVNQPEVFEGEIFNPIIVADSFDEADGGAININAETVFVGDSGQISTSTNGLGRGGNIKIETEELTVTNSELDFDFVTGIFSASGIEPTEAELGKGGNITISTETATINNQALISARSLSAGDAGTIVFESKNLDIINQGSLNTSARGDGAGGNLNLAIDNLNLNGGQISTSTEGIGTGGDIKFEGDLIKISGTSPVGNSGIFAVGVIGAGDAGNIDLNATTINLKDGGVVSASNFSSANADLTPGTGAPGKVKITANSLNIVDEATVETGILSKVNQNTGGNIELNVSDVQLSGEQATISSASLGAGKGGDINLVSQNVAIEERGTITVAASATGDAGSISIQSDRLTGDNSKILAESVESGGGEINLNTGEIVLNNNSLISTSVAESDGGGGDLTIENQELILLRNNSDLRANAVNGPGGNINITTDLMFRDLDSDIDASSQFGIDGTVEVQTINGNKNLNTTILPETIESTAMIAGACPVADENSFANVGNGGIPSTPEELNSIQSAWSDLRPLSPAQSIANASTSTISQPAPIYEADRLITDATGDIYLLANERIQGDRWSQSDCQ